MLWNVDADNAILTGIKRSVNAACCRFCRQRACRGSFSVSDELRFEPIGVFQIRSVVLRTTCIRVLVREHQLPAVQLSLSRQLVDHLPASHVEGQMIKPRSAPIVPARRAIGRLLHDNVSVSRLPASPARPVLEHPVAERGE